MIQNYLNSTASKYASKWLVLVVDVILVSFSFVLAYFILFNLTMNFDINKLFVQLPFVALISLVSFFIIGSYKGVVRHTGVRDVYNILMLFV